MKEAVPEGGPPIVRDSGANNEGPGLSGFQPTMILETGERVPSKGWSCSQSGFRRPGDTGYNAGYAAKSICLGGTAYLDGYGGWGDSVHEERIE